MIYYNCQEEQGLTITQKGERRKMQGMTDRQMQFIAWLITTATDKCQSMEEVREMNKEIRKHSTVWKSEDLDKGNGAE